MSCIELDWYTLNVYRKCNDFDRRFKAELQVQIGPATDYSSAFTFFEVGKFISKPNTSPHPHPYPNPNPNPDQVDRFISQNYLEYPGHITAQIGLWMTWLVLNTLPEATRVFGDAPLGCTETVDFQRTCSAVKGGVSVLPQSETGAQPAACAADSEGCDCPEYRAHILSGNGRFRQWRCAMYRYCTYMRSNPNPNRSPSPNFNPNPIR